MGTTLQISITVELPDSGYSGFALFTGNDIINARVVEEIDPISLSLVGSEFDFKVYTEDPRFNVIDGEFSAAIAQNQLVNVVASHDGTQLFFGNYYTSEYSAVGEYLYEFKCIDIVTLMESLKFDGLFLPEETEISEILDSILGPHNISYELGPFPPSIKLKGWIATGNVRDAVHQVACACGGTIEKLQDGGIKLTRSRVLTVSSSPDHFIPRQLKLDSQKVVREPMVSSITVMTHEYLPAYDYTQRGVLFEQRLQAGTHTVYFGKPCFDVVCGWYSTPAGTPPEHRVPLDPEFQGTVEIDHHMAVVSMDYEATVVIEGHEWRSYSRDVNVVNEDSDSIRLRNDIVIEGVTLGDIWASGRILHNSMYRYFLLEYVQEVSIVRTIEPIDLNMGAQYGQKEYGNFYYISEGDSHGGLANINVNHTVDVQTLYGKTVRGIVEKMELDLTGGMIAKLRVRCYELKE